MKITCPIVKAAAILVAALSAYCQHAAAMPAIPRTTMMLQPDGTAVEVRVVGDEYCHAVTSADGIRVLERNQHGWLVDAGAFDAPAFATRAGAIRAAVRGSAAASTRVLEGHNFPAHGQQRALAILVEYPSTERHPAGRRFEINDPRGHFDALLNSPGYDTDGATGSVHEWFADASSGVLDLTFDVYGPVMLSHDVSHYVARTNGESLNAWEMALEGCTAIDSEVDFTAYDRDHDGCIDNVYVFYAGPGAATGGDPDDCIWQHASDVEAITGRQYTFDGVRLRNYACSNEYRDVASPDGGFTRLAEGIGTVCHEFSHVLGLPDLYDTSGMGLVTPGQWSVMDAGCHLNESRTPCTTSALERMMLGWLEPGSVESTPQRLSLRHVASANEAWRIDTPVENEYFLLENRQQSGWDAYLPGHGMIVWRINYSPEYWERNQVNTQYGRLGVDIVRACGFTSAATAAAEPFPGTNSVSQLTDEGYPNMRTRDGLPTGIPLSGIVEAGGVVSFDVCTVVTELAKPSGLHATDLRPHSFTASWEPDNLARSYVFNLSRTTADGAEIPVEAYTGIGLNDHSIAVSGLEESTTYRFTVSAVTGQTQSPVSDPCVVTTPRMGFEYTAPVAHAAASVGTDCFTADWEPLEGAAGYLVSVLTPVASEPLVTSVDFADGLGSLPSGWTTNCSFTISMNGYFGATAPALSMTDDYGRLQSPVSNHGVTGLSFWYRERSGSGLGRIEISGLADGSWQSADSVVLEAPMTAGLIYELPEELADGRFSAIRIVYRRPERGSLAIDDVRLAQSTGSMTLPLPSHTDLAAAPGALTLMVDGLESATEYAYTVTALDAGGHRSLPSNPVGFATADPAGIDSPVAQPAACVSISPDGVVTVGCDDSPEVYDLAGRPIGTHLTSHGIYLVRSAGVIYKIVY